MIKAVASHAMFALPIAMQFQGIMLPLHIKISVCSIPCAHNATASEKWKKN